MENLCDKEGNYSQVFTLIGVHRYAQWARARPSLHHNGLWKRRGSSEALEAGVNRSGGDGFSFFERDQ